MKKTIKICDYKTCGKECAHSIKMCVGSEHNGNEREYDNRDVDLCYEHAVNILQILADRGTDDDRASIYHRITGVAP